MELASFVLKQQGIVYISKEVNFGGAPSTCWERQGGKIDFKGCASYSMVLKGQNKWTFV